MPQPEISSQPVCLQVRQPLPSQNTHDMSTSAEGSVKGKYDGRRRIARSRSKNACRKPCSAAFMLAKLTFSPTTSPSSWWNIGECVMSESRRYTRPGAMTASGAPRACSARICTGEVCVRSSRPSAKVEGVVHRARRMIRRDVERFEVVEVILDLRTCRDIEAGAAKQRLDAQPRLGDRMQAARLLAPRPGSVTSMRPAASCRSMSARAERAAARLDRRLHLLPWPR